MHDSDYDLLDALWTPPPDKPQSAISLAQSVFAILLKEAGMVFNAHAKTSALRAPVQQSLERLTADQQGQPLSALEWQLDLGPQTGRVVASLHASHAKPLAVNLVVGLRGTSRRLLAAPVFIIISELAAAGARPMQTVARGKAADGGAAGQGRHQVLARQRLGAGRGDRASVHARADCRRAPGPGGFAPLGRGHAAAAGVHGGPGVWRRPQRGGACTGGQGRRRRRRRLSAGGSGRTCEWALRKGGGGRGALQSERTCGLRGLQFINHVTFFIRRSTTGGEGRAGGRGPGRPLHPQGQRRGELWLGAGRRLCVCVFDGWGGFCRLWLGAGATLDNAARTQTLAPRTPPIKRQEWPAPRWVHGPPAQLLLAWCLLDANERWTTRQQPRSNGTVALMEKAKLHSLIDRAVQVQQSHDPDEARSLQRDLAAIHTAARLQNDRDRQQPTAAEKVGGLAGLNWLFGRGQCDFAPAVNPVETPNCQLPQIQMTPLTHPTPPNNQTTLPGHTTSGCGLQHGVPPGRQAAPSEPFGRRRRPRPL